MKAQFTDLVEILASCDDCGWECESRNAQGLASQHAEKNGHMVTVVATRTHIYATHGRYGMTGTEAKERFSERDS
jgi:hypothetical protein